MTYKKPAWPGPSSEQPDLSDFLYDLGSSVSHIWPWGDPDASQRLQAELAPEMMELFAVWIADGEIYNGGFTQFFSNSFGELAEEAVQGFRRFGMNDFAEVFESACNLPGQRPIPKDRAERQQLLYAKFGTPSDGANIFQLAESQMGTFDTRYYDLLSADDDDRGGFLRPVCGYIDRHPDVFFQRS